MLFGRGHFNSLFGRMVLLSPSLGWLNQEETVVFAEKLASRTVLWNNTGASNSSCSSSTHFTIHAPWGQDISPEAPTCGKYVQCLPTTQKHKPQVPL